MDFPCATERGLGGEILDLSDVLFRTSDIAYQLRRSIHCGRTTHSQHPTAKISALPPELRYTIHYLIWHLHIFTLKMTLIPKMNSQLLQGIRERL
jgi:nitrous oxidase accessory protein NosD